MFKVLLNLSFMQLSSYVDTYFTFIVFIRGRDMQNHSCLLRFSRLLSTYEKQINTRHTLKKCLKELLWMRKRSQ